MTKTDEPFIMPWSCIYCGAEVEICAPNGLDTEFIECPKCHRRAPLWPDLWEEKNERGLEEA